MHTQADMQLKEFIKDQTELILDMEAKRKTLYMSMARKFTTAPWF